MRRTLPPSIERDDLAREVGLDVPAVLGAADPKPARAARDPAHDGLERLVVRAIPVTLRNASTARAVRAS